MRPQAPLRDPTDVKLVPSTKPVKSRSSQNESVRHCLTDSFPRFYDGTHDGASLCIHRLD